MSDQMDGAVPTESLEGASVGEPVLQIEGLRQEFKQRRGGEDFAVAVDSLSLPRGAFVAIEGPNGCGKTTLVTVLALLRRPSNLRDLGCFKLNLPDVEKGDSEPIDLKQMWSGWRQKAGINLLRRQYIGFAPQQLELLPALKVHETVASSLWLNGITGRERHARVKQLLDQFGLTKAKVTRNRINNISGGQQQKVTLARAVAHRPALIFLDEPTAYLYHKDAEEALRVLKDLQAESAEMGAPITVVMITHDHKLAQQFADVSITMDVRDVDGCREGCVLRVE